MRVVVLSSSVYSESACALASHLAQSGHTPVGALALRTAHAGTLIRKVGQWGLRASIDYAKSKLSPQKQSADATLRNPQLAAFLEQGGRTLQNLREVAGEHGFPLALCGNQNSPSSIARLRKWSPDIIVFAGGNILRRPLLDVPRLGVLNAHLGLLPEIRGMSSPEWSLLTGVPVGVTIHYIDSGIDTGPILQRCEFRDAPYCKSLDDLRNKLIASGIEKLVGVVAAIDRGTISSTPQSEVGHGFPVDSSRNDDTQFFVMHEWLQARSAETLAGSQAKMSESNPPHSHHA